ncbi:potassium channel family protein [Streptomyces sp. NPDC060194]|uniref:potassium channel family protein n=1 Tax=Streptomyces sp. NPDC060194 TaxID=3347069 RepID=UPI00365F527B
MTRPRPADAGSAPHRLTAWEHRTEIPLGVASVLFLAAYAVRVLAHDLPSAWRDLCLAVTLATWAAFVVDYAVRCRLSGRASRFVRTRPLDLLVVLLPLLRPLRFVHVYDVLQQRRERPRVNLYARVGSYAGLTTALLAFAGALTVYQAERGAPGASIRTFGDAVWWTCATLATVGYGDVVPVTPLGRVAAVALMACGLALLGAVTGSFASWLREVFTREEDRTERPPEG